MTECDVHPGEEKWVPVLGASGYEVSSRGGFRSVDRVLPDGRKRKGKPLSVRPNTSGYPQVDYTLDDGTPVKGRAVHAIELEAFRGPCPEDQEACHADDRQAHNCLENLRWDWPEGNMADRKRNSPAAPPKPKAICTMCGRNPVTKGSKWRCHDCVVWLGKQAADDIGRKGMSITESAERLRYPSVEGLQRLAERYGGYSVPGLPGDVAMTRLDDAESRRERRTLATLRDRLRAALRRGDAA